MNLYSALSLKRSGMAHM